MGNVCHGGAAPVGVVGSRCRGGDDAAVRQQRFADLYDRQGRKVLAWTLRRVSAQADAEDILSETFAVCWRRLDDVPDGDAAAAWLYTVASFVLANHRRGSNRREQLASRIEQERPMSGEVDDRQLEMLEDAMSQLRAGDAEILRLAAWEDLSPSELGAVFGCSSNAASIRLHRARNTLAGLLHHLDIGSARRARDANPGGPQR